MLTFTLDLPFWLGVTVFCDTLFFVYDSKCDITCHVRSWLKLIPIPDIICLDFTLYILSSTQTIHQSHDLQIYLPRFIPISVLKPTAPPKTRISHFNPLQRKP